MCLNSRTRVLPSTRFIQHFFPAQSTPLLESCGVADLVTTCFGGRNRKSAAEAAAGGAGAI